MAGHKPSVLNFKYTIGCTFPFIGQTINFQTITNNQPLDQFYERMAIGFSVTAASGTLGMRFLWANPAMPYPAASGSASGVVLNEVSGFTGIGGTSAGVVQWVARGVTTFAGGGPPTPNVVHIERAAGASVSGTIVVAGTLWNPGAP